MMEHAEVREQLELAAVEPDGLDRLIAGDTEPAAALAGHLAGCPSCTDEFARLRRSTALLREVIAMQPPPELRDRTLAFVAAVGRPRVAAADLEAVDRLKPVALVPEPVTAEPAVAEPARLGGSRGSGLGRGPLGWVAAAAVLLVAIGLTWTVAGTSRDEELRDQAREIAALGQLSAWQLRIDARDDAERVLLTVSDNPSDDAPIGSLAFSPASREMVVSATGLEPPGSGREYRCWVSVNGQRERLGRMYFSAEIAYWVGRVDVLDRVTPGSTFGVSLADAGSTDVTAEPVISGTL